MARWMQIVVVLAIAALIANGQCYALCVASACQAAAAKHADGCHHSSHSQKDGNSGCEHQQSDSMSIEASPYLAKISAVPVSVITAFLPVRLFVPGFDRLAQGYSSIAGRGSPPGQPLFVSFSVLRI